MSIEVINGSAHVIDESIEDENYRAHAIDLAKKEIETTRAKYGIKKEKKEVGKSKINEIFHNDRLRKDSEIFFTTGKMKIDGINKPIVNLYHYLHESKRLNRKLHENSLKVMQSIIDYIKDNFISCDLYDVIEVDNVNDDKKNKIKKDRCILIEKISNNGYYLHIKMRNMKEVTTPNGKVKKLPYTANIHLSYSLNNKEVSSYSKFELVYYKYDENDFTLTTLLENDIDVNDLLPLLKHLITEYIINNNYTEFR